jgi:type IV pilus assembly protein PilM
MFFSKKPESYIGVDLGAGGVKIVELKKEKNRPVLFTYGLMAGSQDIHRILEKKELSAEELLGAKLKPAGEKKIEENTGFIIDQAQVEKFSKMLKATCERTKIVSKTAVASLPVSSVFHAVVTLPIVKKEDFDKILKAEIRKLLPYPIEQMALEYEIIPEEGENQREQRVLINAAPRALVAFYTQIFRNAGLKLESLEPESIALTRALVGRDLATTMLIDIGAERTNFFIVEKAFPITHHSIEIGGDKVNQMIANILGIDFTVGEQVKQDLFTHMMEGHKSEFLKKDNFLAIFSSILEPIIKEIEYSLELFLRQSGNQGKRPEKIVLSGGSAIFPYLADLISEKFKLKCYIGDPFGRVVYQEGLKPVLRKVAPRLSVAIGLALRNVV